MENKAVRRQPGSAPTAVKAAADLELLNRAKSVVPTDQFLDFGPWWYAPMLATSVAGLSLFGQAFSSYVWNGVVGVIAIAAGSIVSIHDYRRRTVRVTPSARALGFLGLIALVCWLIVAAWGTAVSTLGLDRFVPIYAALAWVFTTLFLLAVRAALYAMQRRQTPLQ